MGRFGSLGACLLAALAAGCGSSGASPHASVEGPLAAKARAYDANFQEWHAPFLGGSLRTVFASPDSTEVVQWEDTGDSCIWTGQYLAGEAYRYAVTGEPVAKENARREVAYLDTLLHATGKPGFIARFVGPLGVPELGLNDCVGETDCHVLGDGPYAGNLWRGNTSRDQYTGWFYSLSLVYDLIDDSDMRATIASDVPEVMDRLIADHYLIVDVDGEKTTKGPEILPIFALDYLKVAAQVTGDPAREAFFESESERLELPEYILTIDTLTRYWQYFGFHLSYMNLWNLIRLETDPARKQYHTAIFEERLYNLTGYTHQTLFDYMQMDVTGTIDPWLIDDARTSLHAYPDPPRRAIQPPHPRTQVDPVSVLVPALITALGLQEIVDPSEFQPQALYPYPFAERCNVNYMWQGSPYDFDCGPDDAAFENSPTDYIQAYWMGRYLGFLTAAD